MRRLFVDMDGVLAEFGKVNSEEELYAEGYFLNRPPIQNVVEAVDYLNAFDADIEVFILSAYLTESKYALKEKNDWLNKYLPSINQAHRIFVPCESGLDKKKYIPGGVKPTDYLLDDYTNNLVLWEPPAKGVKLINGINDTRGTWKGHRVSSGQDKISIVKILHTLITEEIHDGFDFTM